MYLINLLAAEVCASCRFEMSDVSWLMTGEGQKQWNKHALFAPPENNPIDSGWRGTRQSPEDFTSRVVKANTPGP